MKKLIKNRNFYLLLSLFVFCLAAGPVWAAYTVDFPLPNMNSSTVSDPATYIRSFFIFGLILAGFLAVGAIVFGGITYLLAGTTITSVERAKKIIGGAITGLLLLLCSYLLLYTIDPTLTDLSPFKLKPANVPASQGGTKCTNLDEVFDSTSNKCVTLKQLYGQPDTAECKDPTQCTEEKCGPGATKGKGACVPTAEFWDAKGIKGQNCACAPI